MIITYYPTGKKHLERFSLLLLFLLFILFPQQSLADDLQQIKQRGVLRHLGISYAHFVMNSPKGPTGLDVELIQLFAKHLGVKYQFVPADWGTIFTDLTGQKHKESSNEYYNKATEEIKGDLIANGLTILPWRQKIVDYSLPTFPPGVWLIGPAQSPLMPIQPSGDVLQDIRKVKTLLKGHTVLTVKHTCLDPKIFQFNEAEVGIEYYTASNSLDELVPSILKGSAETTLLDIPDALIALQNYSDEIKILGPVTKTQLMGVAFPKSSPEIRAEFNSFFLKIWRNGTYLKLVKKYYPSVFLYFGDFFKKETPQ